MIIMEDTEAKNVNETVEIDNEEQKWVSTPRRVLKLTDVYLSDWIN